MHLARLPKSKQIIYKTYLVEMEIINGGFSQFYYNQGLEIAGDWPTFLGILGANKRGEIVKRANDLYRLSQANVIGIEKTNFEELVRHRLNVLDLVFYKEWGKLSIMELRTKHIEDNIEGFRLDNY